MHPMHHAITTPEKAACIVADTGETVNYRALDEASNRGAHLLRSRGLKRGDVMAVMLDNEAAIFEVAWAAQRAGIRPTPKRQFHVACAQKLPSVARFDDETTYLTKSPAS